MELPAVMVVNPLPYWRFPRLSRESRIGNRVVPRKIFSRQVCQTRLSIPRQAPLRRADGDTSRRHDALHHVVLFEAPVQWPEPIQGKLLQFLPETIHTRRVPLNRVRTPASSRRCRPVYSCFSSCQVMVPIANCSRTRICTGSFRASSESHTFRRAERLYRMLLKRYAS